MADCPRNQHRLPRAQQQQIATSNRKCVEIFETRECDKQPRGSAETPAPGDFRETKRRPAENSAKAFKGGGARSHSTHHNVDQLARNDDLLDDLLYSHCAFYLCVG